MQVGPASWPPEHGFRLLRVLPTFCMAISDRKLGITYNNAYLSYAKRERERGEDLVNICYSYETKWSVTYNAQ